MDEITIRFAQEGDIKDIVELCRLHAEFEKSGYDPQGKEESLGRALFAQNSPLICLIAENKQKILGYATYMKQFSTWDAEFYIYMDCLFLRSDARSLGIGKKLVDRIKEEGRKAGCNIIQWQTPDFNKRAMKFYDRLGALAKKKERYFLDIDS